MPSTATKYESSVTLSRAMRGTAATDGLQPAREHVLVLSA